VGNILTRRDHEGTVFSYKYDELNRLTEYRKEGQLQESYTYDKVGNLLTRTKPGELTELEYNAAHQLIAATVSAGTTTYEYDGAGRLNKKTSPKGVTNYSYTQDDRLAYVELPSGVKIEYEYSASGKYVARVADGERTERLLDNDHLHAEYLDGVFDQLYLTGAQTDEWIGMNPEGEDPVYFHQDHLNSITAQTGPYGSLQATREYSPFGEVLSDTGMDIGYGYTGRLVDSQSGLMQYRERWYSPAMSRFITQDPIRGQIDEPASRHRYMYALNNPIRYNDPSGLGWMEDAAMNSLFAEICLSIPYMIAVNVAIAMASCYSPLAQLVLGYIDLAISFVAAMFDVIFTYRNVRGANCAIPVITVLSIFGVILVTIKSGKWTRCDGVWGLAGWISDGLKQLLQEAAKYIVTYFVDLISKAIGNKNKASQAFWKAIYLTLLNSVFKLYNLVKFYGFFIGIVKLVMAPELCIGFCMLVFL
jgi:RHS repeat-associated protein